MFGLTGEKAFQEAGTLSGGEKTKLALAQLVAGRHNLLLLDEPTNNLDPPSREAVADALAGVARRDGGRQPRRRVRASGWQPDRVLLMPDGDVDYWTDDLARPRRPRLSVAPLASGPWRTRGTELRVALDGGVATVTIDNPPINLFDLTLYLEMRQVAERARRRRRRRGSSCCAAPTRSSSSPTSTSG